MEFYSQHKQDEYVYNRFFKNKKNGVFVDIGASNGIDLSNSYFFEKELSWSGICVEPQEFFFKDLSKNRNCVCIQGCVSDFNGVGRFMEIGGYGRMLSGLVDKYDKKWINVVNNVIESSDSEKNEINVNCHLLNDILIKYDIKKIDFCSIDVEGCELDILKTIDFKKFHFDVFTIENNYSDINVRNFLRERGFDFIEVVGVDEIYKRKNT
jgi:FkbM family methyltransferase